MGYVLNALGVPLYTSGTSTHTFSAKASIDLFGTPGNDTFWGNSTYTTTMYGGLGDDRYYLYSYKNIPVELPNEGIDTVSTWMNYKLPDNIENLNVSASDSTSRYAFGNSMDNIINGGAGRQFIDGFKGNDVLSGGADADTFIFTKGNGSDLVRDFGIDDTARIGSYGYKSFAQTKAHMTQVGPDVHLGFFNGEKIVFANKTIDRFAPDDFQYALDKSHMHLTFEDQFSALSLWNGVKGAGAQGTWDSNFFWGQPNGHVEPAQSSWMIDTDYGPTKSLNPFHISTDGHLTITAQKTPDDMLQYVNNSPYVSGRLNTHYSFSQLYGYFEARIDMPDHKGDWPAFWLLPQDNSWPPELDAIEMRGADPNALLQTAHSKATGTHTMDGGTPAVETTAGYHTYGVLWTPTQIVWYFDGVETRRTATPADMHKPMFMVIDHGTGMGTPDFTTSDMHIDCVRALQLNTDFVV